MSGPMSKRKKVRLTVNASSIKNTIKGRKKTKATFYIEEREYADFQKNCEKDNLKMSQVIEELIRSFNKSC